VPLAGRAMSTASNGLVNGPPRLNLARPTLSAPNLSAHNLSPTAHCPYRMDRRAYAETYGPNHREPRRLADTELILEGGRKIFTTYGPRR